MLTKRGAEVRQSMKRTLLILGATGYIGRHTVREACAAGWHVKALVRNQRVQHEIRGLGGEPIMGNGLDASSWTAAARDADAVVDLIQPELPARLTAQRMKSIVGVRLRLTRAILEALSRLPQDRRPRLISVSGTDDLQPDLHGRIHGRSALRSHPKGFGRIGIPVRQLISDSGMRARFVNLAHVYGPGKAFAARVFPGLARGRFPVIGRGQNRLGLIHVEDAARALVHVAGLPRDADDPLSYVVADGAQTTLQGFLQQAASLMGAREPHHVPRWLARIAVGKVMVHELTADLDPDPGDLLATGFDLRYPSPGRGLPPTLESLGFMGPTGSHA